jgi:5-methylcytosine-specific restriction enzyme A
VPPKPQRTRGYALQKIRKRILGRNPLCVRCNAAGRTRLATEVDHIVPLHKGGEDSDSNRQGLCSECHVEKTREDLGQALKVAIGLDGYPIE